MERGRYCIGMKPLLAALFALSCVVAQAQERLAYLRGYVYDLASGHYLYTELHEARMRGDEWMGGTARFFAPDGREFGRKTLDFARDRYVPVYRLELGQYVDGITDNGDVIAMLRQKPGASAKTGTAERGGLIAADSGLPRLLTSQFDALKRGEPVQFRVAAPSRLETYRFRATRIADETFEGKPAVTVRLDMDSMLKLFAGPIIFLFDPATKRLLEFRGTTNVHPAADGEMHKVRISYYSAPPKDATGVPALP
jgi:hypothetical protein